MATATGVYQGELRTKNRHELSGSEMVTDAPVDNQGMGSAFSPTDLVATAYATCMVTIMGINAREKGLDMTGTSWEVTKIMYDQPRRIGEIHIHLTFPPRDFSARDRKVLEAIAHTCPVAYSIHPEIKREITFNWL